MIRLCPVVGARRYVLQPSKPRFDLLLVDINRQVEILVEVPTSAHPIVGLVYGIKQVDDDNSDVDSPAMLEVSRGARLGLGVTGTYSDAVV